MIAEQPLEDLLRTLFSLPDLELGPETGFAEIPGWDSLSHVNVIFEVERRFGVRFSDQELDRLQGLATIGELQSFIDEKPHPAGS